MEKFEKTAKKLLKILPQLREECVEFLTNKLRENNNKLSWDCCGIGEYVSVCYDGGRHQNMQAMYFLLLRVFLLRMIKSILILKMMTNIQ